MASHTPATRTANRADGSATTVQTESTPSSSVSLSGTLRLRAEPAETQHVQWADDVVDNEGMGKKSSKVCCIYHKPRAVGESSSDESSGSSSSEDDTSGGEDDGTARPAGGSKRECDDHRHHHGHNHGRARGHKHNSDRKKGEPRKPSPNAYERMPTRSGNTAGPSK